MFLLLSKTMFAYELLTCILFFRFMNNMMFLLLSKIMFAYELLTCILFFRFVKTILITELITAIGLKDHGHFPHQIMDGLYRTVLQRHFR
jgi:hypothetical protein